MKIVIKKITLLLLLVLNLSFSAFSQSNLHNAQILGSTPIGNKEVTSVLDKVDGCTHKSDLHTKGLFSVGENVLLEMGDDIKRPKIIKPTLPEVVFVDKCKDNSNPSILADKMFIPNGSKIERVDENTITVTPSEEWQYVFRKQNEDGTTTSLMRGGSFSLVCSCTEKDPSSGGEGGCHPRLGGDGSFECLITSPCTECKRSTSVSIAGELLRISEGSGYVNLSAGISFVETFKPMPAFFETMLEIPQIKMEMDSFVRNIYQNRPLPKLNLSENNTFSAPDGHSFVLVNAFGRVLSLLVPNDYVVNQRIGSVAVTCACVNGGGTCEPKEDDFYIICVNKCEDGACALTPSTSIPIKEKFKVFNY